MLAGIVIPKYFIFTQLQTVNSLEEDIIGFAISIHESVVALNEPLIWGWNDTTNVWLPFISLSIYKACKSITKTCLGKRAMIIVLKFLEMIIETVLIIDCYQFRRQSLFICYCIQNIVSLHKSFDFMFRFIVVAKLRGIIKLIFVYRTKWSSRKQFKETCCRKITGNYHTIMIYAL